MFPRKVAYLGRNSVLCKSLVDSHGNVEGGGLVGHTFLDGTIGEGNLDGVVREGCENSMLAFCFVRTS